MQIRFPLSLSCARRKKDSRRRRLLCRKCESDETKGAKNAEKKKRKKLCAILASVSAIATAIIPSVSLCLKRKYSVHCFHRRRVSPSPLFLPACSAVAFFGRPFSFGAHFERCQNNYIFARMSSRRALNKNRATSNNLNRARPQWMAALHPRRSNGMDNIMHIRKFLY